MLAALETSTRSCSVALFDMSENKNVGETFLPEDSEGASVLLPALRELLLARVLSVSDLKALAVSIGPGSFTGIRVGIATAQGLCLPTSLTVFGISALDALAENLRSEGWTGEALCLLDAQRGECFTGHYQISENKVAEIDKPQILAPSRFPGLLKGPVIVVGPAALKYEKEIRETLGAHALFPLSALHRPRASSLVALAAKRWRAGERPTLEELKPLYMRLAAPDEIKK
jgi:tRNA threonylcarbamoyladenosine biosynthesis protein TsaB